MVLSMLDLEVLICLLLQKLCWWVLTLALLLTLKVGTSSHAESRLALILVACKVFSLECQGGVVDLAEVKGALGGQAVVSHVFNDLHLVGFDGRVVALLV